jgi:hypothetical protein
MRHLAIATILVACTSHQPDSATFHGTVDAPVTHVMAVGAVAGTPQRIVAPVEAGAFSISVDADRPWALVFVDATRTGSAMVAGVLRVDSLDTFYPQFAGDIELGVITIADNVASMTTEIAELDSALGIDRAVLATIAVLDDLAPRYSNPDVDGDGMIDTVQAPVELHADYMLVADGRAATADDFITNAAAVRYEHVGTGIYSRLPDAFGPLDRADASVIFEQPFYGFAAGRDTPPVPAGEPITALTFGDHQSFGVYARAGFDIPHGAYQFRSGGRTLEFTSVRPPSTNEMTTSMHQVMPRIRFVPADPLCAWDCAVATVEFAWQRRTEVGWVALADVEAQVLAPAAILHLLAADGTYFQLAFPTGVVSGSVPWTGTVTTSSIAYMNLAFSTRHGMKMYASLGDAVR